ncbi:hypothetical protein M0G43_13965 [Subsaxibacter sp. CAU 1640]|uniref:hypothetical protein n=1 Tax=Subsaxibacter sp. CAU 1640 TaxID=2933271 RepID=UPI002003AEF9|nr:hypothetical protein [Subsaxibacter sp. CAU 1640]MCK7591690.1 hypothetical protein [Subsaxibacter sp. CAU 1640]
MAQDLKKMFSEDRQKIHNVMPTGHEARFLKKLEEELPATSIKKRFSIWNIAASAVVLLGLSFGAYQYFKTPSVIPDDKEQVVTLKSLGDVSPDLKKVEDYYVANINLELANVKLTPENKELFDSYIVRLEELNKEYNRLSVELTENGPNELTVSALIDNLKLRLNLLYRLKEQLNELNTSEEIQNIS